MKNKFSLNIKIDKIPGWKWCVSTSSSYMSLSWREHFFVDEEEARNYWMAAKEAGFAALIVSQDEY